ncbi:MAG TPA: lysophospholipase [Patescibacteria group bacterium]|nr:lysophospholipase [Patescibacteria group bacterium]
MTTTTTPTLGVHDQASWTGHLTARDGTDLQTRHWPVVGDPWASIILVHGIAEHSGRYERVGQWLAGAGLAVHAYDQRGFGGSAGRRAYVERWSLQHDDLEEVLLAVRRGAPDRPVVLFGHSLGGLIALGFVVADRPRPMPDALVLSAPALAATLPGWKRVLVRVLGAVAPTVTVRNDLDGTLLSRDPAIGAAYLADPLNVHVTTTRFGAAALAEQARVRARLGRLSVPTLVYHGEADRLVPTESSAPLARLVHVTRRTLPDLRHESHNEPEGPAVAADVVSWLRPALA